MTLTLLNFDVDFDVSFMCAMKRSTGSKPQKPKTNSLLVLRNRGRFRSASEHNYRSLNERAKNKKIRIQNISVLPKLTLAV